MACQIDVGGAYWARSEIVARREGDLPEFWANAEKAHDLLGWIETRSVSDMMEDTWRWQSQNPNGYTCD